MIIDELKAGDIFTDPGETKVKVESLTQDNNEVRCNLRRIEGQVKGSSYIHFFKITPDGKIDLKDCTDFVPKR